MSEQVDLHELAQRLRDAAAPALGRALAQVDEFLFVGEEGLAISSALAHLARPVPTELADEIADWASTLPPQRAGEYLELLELLGRSPATA